MSNRRRGARGQFLAADAPESEVVAVKASGGGAKDAVKRTATPNARTKVAVKPAKAAVAAAGPAVRRDPERRRALRKELLARLAEFNRRMGGQG